MMLMMLAPLKKLVIYETWPLSVVEDEEEKEANIITIRAGLKKSFFRT